MDVNAFGLFDSSNTALTLLAWGSSTYSFVIHPFLSQAPSTEFHRSSYRIYQLLDNASSTTERNLCMNLEGEGGSMLFDADDSLGEFLRSLCGVNQIAEKGEGYVLTVRGVRERDRLAKIVEDEDIQEDIQHKSSGAELTAVFKKPIQ